MAGRQTCSLISASRAACVAAAAALSAGSSFPGDVTGTERVTSRVVKRLARACHKPFLLHISVFLSLFPSFLSLSLSPLYYLCLVRLSQCSNYWVRPALAVMGALADGNRNSV